jgi:hypothetical protein
MSDILTKGEAHGTAWSGYWWPMREDPSAGNIYEDGGPLDKYDLFCVASGLTNPRARDFEKWQHWSDERMERATGQKTSWWGHCNGWAAAAVLEPEPTTPRSVATIHFGIGDQKGLLTVVHNADPVDVIRSLGHSDAHVFHQLLIQSIGRERRGVIFDTKLDPLDPETGQSQREVWNYPAYRYECRYQARGDSTWDVTASVWFASDFVPPDFVGIKNWPVDRQPKVYTYRIHGSRERPTAGVWLDASVKDHPDLVWRPQPLSVQNAVEEERPGGSQTRFHPVRRRVVYGIIAGQRYTPTAVDRQLDAALDLSWEVTSEEQAGYPPPIQAGDFWRYDVSHLDSGGRWSRPFRIQIEVVGWTPDRKDWVIEISTLAGGAEKHVRHVVYLDQATRMLSSRAPYDNGYAYSLRQDPEQGGFTRVEEPALWENSPLRRLMSQMPYAWERAGMEPVRPVKIEALGRDPVPTRTLKVGVGQQVWADHTVHSTQGNLRGLWLISRLDRISAEIVEWGHKDVE